MSWSQILLMFFRLNIICLTQHKVVGQKNMERKHRALILLDVCMLHVIAMGGCSVVQLTYISTSAEAGPGNEPIPLNYII